MIEVHRRVRRRSYLLIYFFTAVVIIMAHGPLLQLPYYWDEAGQFIPAATDLFRSGSWISHSATPNVHPPGVMAWLALAWHIFGFTILTTRIAMMLLACFGVLTTFLLAIELSRGSPGAPAITAVTLLCISPLFFAQSVLAQLDMPAMGFTALALLLFLQNRFRDAALACVALVLLKETGFVVPVVFTVWLVVEPNTDERRWREALWFVMPAAALLAWLLALRHATGHWFGNAEFTQYNLVFTLNPVRFLFSILRRLYYLFVGSGHFIGTAVVCWTFRRMPLLRDRQWRVAASLAAAHIVAVTALGGAVLERYLLPVLPILYIAFAVSLSAVSLRSRRWSIAGLVVCLIAANFINPPYPFPFENNLAFVSFVDVQREATFAADTYPGTVATTFPMTTALAQPDNGFLMLPRKVRELPDFRPGTIAALINNPPPLMLVYDTALDPRHIRESHAFQWFFGRFYRYERPMSANEISQLLNMHVARRIDNNGISMFLLVNDAMTRPQTSR